MLVITVEKMILVKAQIRKKIMIYMCKYINIFIQKPFSREMNKRLLF